MQGLKSFEASLHGVLPSSDLEPVLQRCSLLCSASSLGRFHWREILFEADRTHANSATFALNPANMRSLDVKIACRRDAEVTKDSEPPWTFYAYQSKPEVSKRPVTLREATTMTVLAGNAMGFASALGYQKASEIRKRGFEFERGKVMIHIFRVDQVDPIAREVILAPEDTPWHVEVRTAPVRQTPANSNDPSRSAPTERATIDEQIDAVLEFKNAMKGLLDLAPFASSKS